MACLGRSCTGRDGELEDAATTLGSRTFHTMTMVTIPLVMPAVIGGFILSFVQGVTLFGVPAFLLAPAGIPVVTIRLAEFYQQFPPGLAASAAYWTPPGSTGWCAPVQPF
jgi:iron(III) transport system permease protein